jgi:hypothetical protein
MPIKYLELNLELKAALQELAYQSRTSMSQYVGAIVDDVAAGRVAIERPERPKNNATVKYEMPPRYDDASAVAREAGVSLSEVLRQELARRASGGPRAPQPETPQGTREDTP